MQCIKNAIAYQPIFSRHGGLEYGRLIQKIEKPHSFLGHKFNLIIKIMAVFNGEVTIKVEFEDFQVAVGYGYTSEIIKHKCLEQAYARSTWSKIKDLKDPRFKVSVVRSSVK